MISISIIGIMGLFRNHSKVYVIGGSRVISNEVLKGICGSTLAGANGAPTILVNHNVTATQKTYIKSIITNVKIINIIGGENENEI